jgi:hypothetical protein
MSVNDVQTYYYDEGHGKWITIGPPDDRPEQVVALTGHFTTSSAPRSPSPTIPTRSCSTPTRSKGIKVGDSTGLASR